MNDSIRLDLALVKRGLARSRETAKEYLSQNAVFVNGTIQTKAAFRVSERDSIECYAHSAFVGRGGLKLEKAIRVFSLNLTNAVCLDAGASTGGFTDCMLKYGAATVYAVEGGHDQLAKRLRADERVKSFENTDIRKMPSCITESKFDFIASDLSFISLKMVIPYLFPLLKSEAVCVLLVKPQFEAGRSAVGKNGIVKSYKEHIRVLEEIMAFVHAQQFAIGGVIPSPIRGGSGNIEYLLCCGKSLKEPVINPLIVVDEAFSG